MAARFSKPGQWGHGFAHMIDTPQGRDHRWTGKVEMMPDRLTLPLRWRLPGFVFPSSTSDIFHEAISDDEIAQILAVMAMTPHLIYQLLTKRADRMREYLSQKHAHADMLDAASRMVEASQSQVVTAHTAQWPMPNLWTGVSVEDQSAADSRLPELAETPSVMRWVSFEPLIGPVNAAPWMPIIGWAVVGGESGPGARDNDFLGNARSLRDQCKAAGVPFFGKQNFRKGALPHDLAIREMP